MKKHLTSLHVVRKDGTTGTYPSNYHRNREKGIQKLKRILMTKEFGRWEIAYLYDAQAPQGSAPLCAFHPLYGVDELDKVTAEALRTRYTKGYTYRAYCIPPLIRQILGASPYTLYIQDMAEGKQELEEKGLEKIAIYNKENEIIRWLTA